jgi:predicted RNA-binding Zn-ribbon protein involved in translation (DUF1610 family)
MSECPYCQEPAEDSALFCRSCGASLRLPEYTRAFCPHCGARVTARQEFCHECHWPLVKSAAAEPGPDSEAPSLTLAKPSPWKNPWVWGSLIVAGLLIALIPWLFISGPTPPSGSESPSPKVIAEKPVSATPAPALPAPASPTGEGAALPTPETPLSAVVLKNQLTELLNQLREAQLKKDISLYSQVFASNFPDFDKRRQKTLAVWEAYDYSNLDFELQEVKVLEGDQAFARVTWTLNIQQKATPAVKAETQSYKVWFSKDGGKWRISNLELVRKPG